jgi:hypothetical protein
MREDFSEPTEGAEGDVGFNPLEEWEEEWEEEIEGWEDDDQMDMRDWAAGLALQAVLDAEEDSLKDTETVREKATEWARRAYIIADALMEVRDEDDELDVAVTTEE